MKRIALLLFVFLSSKSMAQSNLELSCNNDSFLKEAINLSIPSSEEFLLTTPNCSLNFVEVLEQKNYEGWVLVRPSSTQCLLNTKLREQPRRQLKEILISDEVAAGQSGYVRIAVDNEEAEYGPLVIRTFLYCR